MDTERQEIVRLLAEDVAATLGEAHRQAVSDEIPNALEFTDTVEDFARRLVDGVQQFFHDTFADTTWPACPRHPNHPLWFRDGAWWCEADGVAVARLGELRP
jgi:hypothetical protein